MSEKQLPQLFIEQIKTLFPDDYTAFLDAVSLPPAVSIRLKKGVSTDIDDIVKIVRFDGWQSTTAGKQEVKKALRSVVWIKYKIKDKDVFDKAYGYIEQYY